LLAILRGHFAEDTRQWQSILFGHIGTIERCFPTIAVVPVTVAAAIAATESSGSIAILIAIKPIVGKEMLNSNRFVEYILNFIYLLTLIVPY
jgi:hypothetical protein